MFSIKLFSKLHRSTTYSASRLTSTAFGKGAYQGTGKTTIEIQNTPKSKQNLIDGYNQFGFFLTNQTFILGPVLLFPDTVLCWNIRGDDHINETTLEFFYHLEPQIDLLIVGHSGEDKNQTVDPLVPVIGRRHGFQIELLPSTKACQLYNFLVIEGRSVAAALVPPARVQLTPEDVNASRQRTLMCGGENEFWD